MDGIEGKIKLVFTEVLIFIDVQEDLWEDTPDACNHYAREDKVGIWKD